MNEKTNEKNFEKKEVLENNSQHRKGYVFRVINISEPSKEGMVRAMVKIQTSESYTDAEKNWQKKNTYTDVVIFTKDPEKIEKLKGIQTRLEALNAEENPEKQAEMYKTLDNAIELNGQFESRLGKKDLEEIQKEIDTLKLEGAEAAKKRANLEMMKMADNCFLTVVDGNTTLNNKHEEQIFTLSFDKKQIQASKSAGNTGELKGNIAKIDLSENHANMSVIVSIPVSAYNAENEKYEIVSKDVPFKVQVYSKRLPETFEDIKSGKIGIGDTVRVRGQYHNNNFETKDNKNVYDTRLDLNYLDILDRSQKQRRNKEEEIKKNTQPEQKPEKAKPKRTRKTL